MKLVRVGIGGVLTIIGVLSWFRILDENTPKPTDTITFSPITMEVILAISITAIISGIGVWLLGSGMRSSSD